MARDRAKIGAAALLLVLASAPAFAHPCDDDAISRAGALLRLHFNAQESDPVKIDKTVKELPPIRALEGNGHLDVLEVWGHIYQGNYRMRFVYAQYSEACVLIGEEIIQDVDPYHD